MIVWLLVGAIVNVAVAWGWPKFKRGIADYVSAAPANPQPMVINFPVTVGSHADAFNEFILFGWPCVSYNGAGDINVAGSTLNTIFYASVLWLLFSAPGKVRRWRRLQRGLCPACAYPIGTSDICTECGQRVKDAST